MSYRRHARSIAALLTCFAAAVPACSSTHELGERETGSAEAAVTNVPNDGTVACIAITATGSWATTQSFDVVPGQSTVFSLAGIPTGTVRFDGAAYATACGLVTSTSTPTWASAPVFAPVGVGQTANVQINLQPAGSAGVGVNFNPNPNCRANGLPCLTGAECCSSSCGVTGVCAPPVGCALPSDCPGPSTECRIVTCTNGACGVVLPPAGTLTTGQAAGDCQVIACDGAGSFAVISDPTDAPPDDGNACTLELCQAGNPTVVPVAPGAPCAGNGGVMCDGNGACVQCLVHADCPPGYTCMGNACAPPQCGDGLKNGTETDVDCGGPNCGPCSLGKACATDVDCTAGAYCGAGICAPLKANGQPAIANHECVSGAASDGVCCNFPCTGLCSACTAAKKGSGSDGACGFIQAGADPDAECGGQVCDGAGSCAATPSVVSTTPADGGSVLAGPTVSVTFSQAMSPATLAGQSVAGACVGSVQVSLDGFATCVALPSAPVMSAGNAIATFTAAPGLLVNRAYQIRVTTAAKSAAGVALASAYTTPLGFTTTGAQGCSNVLVVSQVYGAGGFSGAVYRNDFVELHNRGTTTVSLNGLSLQYSTATGTTWTAIPLSGSIQPGGYYLVQFASGGANGLTLPSPDLTSAVNLGSVGGKVALVNGTAALPAGACPPPGSLDFVGYGASNCAEGVSTAAPSASSAVVRGAAGCADTDANSFDLALAAPTPRNTTSGPNACACAGATVRNESNAPLEADYCAVRFPLSATVQTGLTTPTFYGRVFEPGMTGMGSPSASVRAQIGYGPPASNPEYEAGFTWVNATYNSACVGCGVDDEYQASFTAPAAGTYIYVYRVSVDQGQTWTYCDLQQGDSGAGSSAGLTFDLQNAGVLTVTP